MKTFIKKIILFSIGLLALSASQHALAETCNAEQLMEFIREHNLEARCIEVSNLTLTNINYKDLSTEHEQFIRSIIANLPGIPFDINTLEIKASNKPQDAASWQYIDPAPAQHLMAKRFIFINETYLATVINHIHEPKYYEQLRFIIAHEVGHLVLNHALLGIKRYLQLKFLISDEKNRELFRLNNAFRKRRHEIAADRWAIDALGSKEGAITFFNDQLTTHNFIDIDLVTAPNSSHPSHQYRLDCIRYDHIELPWYNWETS